jgi:hypothetical protein
VASRRNDGARRAIGKASAYYQKRKARGVVKACTGVKQEAEQAYSPAPQAVRHNGVSAKHKREKKHKKNGGRKYHILFLLSLIIYPP